jgi:carboxyl-terminal processing protease
LIATHDARVSKDKDFQSLREDIAEFNTQRKKNLISLNETDRRKEREMQEARILSREKNNATDKGGNATDKNAVVANSAAFEDDGLQSNERNLAADLAIEKARKSAKDVLLNEAVHILSDEVGLLKANARLAATVLPKMEMH